MRDEGFAPRRLRRRDNEDDRCRSVVGFPARLVAEVIRVALVKFSCVKAGER